MTRPPPVARTSRRAIRMACISNPYRSVDVGSTLCRGLARSGDFSRYTASFTRHLASVHRHAESRNNPRGGAVGSHMTRPIRIAVQIPPGGTPSYAAWRDTVLRSDDAGADVVLGYDHF